MSTTAAIADSVLTDAHLHTLGLVPLGTETTVESVALAPEYGSAVAWPEPVRQHA